MQQVLKYICTQKYYAQQMFIIDSFVFSLSNIYIPKGKPEL